MTYGLRINFEYYFLKEARSFIRRAKKSKARQVVMLKILDIKLPRIISYKILKKIYPMLEESKADLVAECAMACLMISFSYEALLNYLYRISQNKTSENSCDVLLKDEIKKLNSRKKVFNSLCKTYQVDPLLFSEDLKILEEIYLSRNDVVHYKEAISNQGFSFETAIESKFKIENTQKGMEAFDLFVEKIKVNFKLSDDDFNFITQKHFLNY